MWLISKWKNRTSYSSSTFRIHKFRSDSGHQQSHSESRCDGQEGLLGNKDRQEHIRRGWPVKLSARDGRQLVRAIQGLPEKEGNFSCQRIMQEAGISVKDVSVRTVSRFLNSQGYYYLQVHKKGVLTVTDMKKRLKFARRMRKDWSRRLE